MMDALFVLLLSELNQKNYFDFFLYRFQKPAKGLEIPTTQKKIYKKST